MFMNESESESENEEIQMYCCLPFAYPVKYRFITLDYDRNSIEISFKSSLSESEKKEIWDKLYNEHITNIHPDYIDIIHCPWCGTHVSTVIDFDKGSKLGQYSSKENWER
jgi:hypothetical protein